MCVTHGWILGQPATFLKMVAGQERLYLDIISPARLGKYVWAWLVNEDNWVNTLWASVIRDLLAGGSGPKPMVPTIGTLQNF